MSAFNESMAVKRPKRQEQTTMAGPSLFDAPPTVTPPKSDTQCGRIYQYMLRHGSITDEQARRDLGTARLAARIYDLRDKYKIHTTKEMVKVVNRYGETTEVARYSLDMGGN